MGYHACAVLTVPPWHSCVLSLNLSPNLAPNQHPAIYLEPIQCPITWSGVLIYNFACSRQATETTGSQIHLFSLAWFVLVPMSMIFCIQLARRSFTPLVGFMNMKHVQSYPGNQSCSSTSSACVHHACEKRYNVPYSRKLHQIPDEATSSRLTPIMEY